MNRQKSFAARINANADNGGRPAPLKKRDSTRYGACDHRGEIRQRSAAVSFAGVNPLLTRTSDLRASYVERGSIEPRSRGATKLPKEITVIGGVAGLVGFAALLHFVHAGPTLTFICCALALAGVAHVIGEATDQLGNHLGPAASPSSPVAEGMECWSLRVRRRG